MLPKLDECTCQKCSTAALLEKLFYYEWGEEGPAVKRTLTLLTLVYLQSDVCDNAKQADREEVAFHIRIITEMIDELLKFEVAKQKINAA